MRAGPALDVAAASCRPRARTRRGRCCGRGRGPSSRDPTPRSSDRKRGEKSSHFSRTDAVWSPKSILRTSSQGTSSRWLNRGPRSRSTMDLPLPKILSGERLTRVGPRAPGRRAGGRRGPHAQEHGRRTVGTCIEIRPVTRAIGAEVGGIDLREPLDRPSTSRRCGGRSSTTWCSSSATSTSTTTEQLAFALRFGPCTCRRCRPCYQDAPEIVVLDQVQPEGRGRRRVAQRQHVHRRARRWASILRAVQLPELGGDTCFASMYAAYEALSPPMRALRRRPARRPRHHPPLQKAIRDGHSISRSRRDAAAVPAGRAQRRRHPSRDGAQGAVPEPQLDDAPRRGSANARTTCCSRSCSTTYGRPTSSAASTGTPGSIAFWDNRAVQHYAVADYLERRVMHRATIAGPVAR